MVRMYWSSAAGAIVVGEYDGVGIGKGVYITNDIESNLLYGGFKKDMPNASIEDAEKWLADNYWDAELAFTFDTWEEYNDCVIF